VTRAWALVLAVAATCCAAPVEPSRADTVDVLDYVIGAADTWPRFGPNHHQHQNLGADRVCWTKYTLPWSYECWRWDANFVYHELDHAIDGARRWEYYTFSDGRWLPRRLPKDGTVWTLDLPENRSTWVDAECNPQPAQAAPYRVRAWYTPRFDAGGDLGVRDTIVLEYAPDPNRAPSDTAEVFYFARGAGWFKWTRGAAVVMFNRIGGIARSPAPLCARDFTG
jgi:hypothetical protein